MTTLSIYLYIIYKCKRRQIRNFAWRFYLQAYQRLLFLNANFILNFIYKVLLFYYNSYSIFQFQSSNLLKYFILSAKQYLSGNLRRSLKLARGIPFSLYVLKGPSTPWHLIFMIVFLNIVFSTLYDTVKSTSEIKNKLFSKQSIIYRNERTNVMCGISCSKI